MAIDLESIVRRVKSVKGSAVSTATRDEEADLLEHLILFREGVELGQVWIAGERHECHMQVMKVVAVADCDFVAHASDSYHFEGDGESSFPDVPLAQLFAQGDPRVCETLTICAMSEEDRALQALFLPYRRHGRLIEWHEPSTPPEGIWGGLVPAAISAGYEMRAKRPADVPPATMQDLANVGFTVAAVEFRRPSPTEPCRCESGQIASECCWRKESWKS